MYDANDDQILSSLHNRASIRYDEHSDSMLIDDKPATVDQAEAIVRLVGDGLVFVEQHIFDADDADEEVVTCGARHIRLTDFGRRMLNS